jgi:uncharacterized membrane protein YkoI
MSGAGLRSVYPAKRLFIFEQGLRLIGQKQTTMKITKLITVIAVSAGLAFGVSAQAGGKKHKEQSISSTDVPAEVQKAAETEAKGGKIVRWEKEGADYEAVIDKNGKEWGFKFDANGKLLGKHDESKEKGEKY